LGGGAAYCSAGCGTVFSLNLTTNAEQIMYSFQGGSDAAGPDGRLLNIGGTLYGTAYFGGGNECKKIGSYGAVFSLNPCVPNYRVSPMGCTPIRRARRFVFFVSFVLKSQANNTNAVNSTHPLSRGPRPGPTAPTAQQVPHGIHDLAHARVLERERSRVAFRVDQHGRISLENHRAPIRQYRKIHAAKIEF
jgi:hypothetical protein